MLLVRTQLCINHRCSHEESLCSKESIAGASRYCTKHSCKECIRLGIFSEQIVSNFPRNTCLLHPLCNFVKENGKICQQVASPDDEYCPDHKELPTFICNGITKKNKPCINKGTIVKGRKHFCPDHQNQGKDDDDNDSNDEEDSDNDGDDDTDQDENVTKLTLHEIFPFHYKRSSNILSMCQNCSVYSYCPAESIKWLCPAHKPIIYRQPSVENQDLYCLPAIKESKDTTLVKENDEETIITQGIDVAGTLVDGDDDEYEITDALAEGLVDFDELDFEELDCENENLRRLQEQTEFGTLEDEFEVEEELDQEDSNALESTDLDSIYQVFDWNWGLSLTERRKATSLLLRSLSNLTTKLCRAVDPYITAARLDRLVLTN